MNREEVLKGYCKEKAAKANENIKINKDIAENCLGKFIFKYLKVIPANI